MALKLIHTSVQEPLDCPVAWESQVWTVLLVLICADYQVTALSSFSGHSTLFYDILIMVDALRVVCLWGGIIINTKFISV